MVNNTLISFIGAEFMIQTGTSRNRTKADLQEGQRVYSMVHDYFTRVYGEVWKSRVATEEDVKFWRMHLVGFSEADIGKAIAEFANDERSQFPPNPIFFRSICLKVKSKKDKSAKSLPFVYGDKDE